MSNPTNPIEVLRQRGKGGNALADLIERVAKDIEANPEVRIRAASLNILLKDGPNSTDLTTVSSMFGVLPHLSAIHADMGWSLTKIRMDGEREKAMEGMFDKLKAALKKRASEKEAQANGAGPDSGPEEAPEAVDLDICILRIPIDGPGAAAEAAPEAPAAGPVGHTPDDTDAQ